MPVLRQDGIYVLEIIYIRPISSLGKLSDDAFKTAWMLLFFFYGRWPVLVPARQIIERFLFLRLSPLGVQWCDMPIAVYPKVVNSALHNLQAISHL